MGISSNVEKRRPFDHLDGSTQSSAESDSPLGWYATTTHSLPEQPALRESINADVCILGAGYTGLSAALELADAGYRVVILEADRVGWGASGRNGGQVIFSFGYGEDMLESHLGREDSRRAFDWSLDALDLIHRRCRRHRIDCDWRSGHAHVAIKPAHIRKLRQWQDRLARDYDYPLEWWERERLRSQLDSPRYLGGLYDNRSGHLHPFKYAVGLGRATIESGVSIYENSAVVRLDRGRTPLLITRHGSVRCQFAILAGNAMVRGIAPELDRRIIPVGTHIAATKPIPEDIAKRLIANDMAVADVNWFMDYFRLTHDGRLLFGGQASTDGPPPRNLKSLMSARIARVFPQLQQIPIEFLWSGVADISSSHMPDWGRLGDNIYFAQGFSGHGIANTGLAGQVIAEAIRGQAERLDVFKRIRNRAFPGGPRMRTPMLHAALAWYKLRDALW
jgi:gamma-glutamylputrescine oxidase